MRGSEGYHGPRCAHKDDCAARPRHSGAAGMGGGASHLRSSSTTEQRLLPHLNCPLPVKTSCCTARQKCVAQLSFRRTAGLRRPCRGGQPQAARPVRTAHSGRHSLGRFPANPDDLPTCVRQRSPIFPSRNLHPPQLTVLAVLTVLTVVRAATTSVTHGFASRCCGHSTPRQ